MKNDWKSEQVREYFSLDYRVKERLFSGQSEFQKVEIVETYGHGRMLFNDDLAMVSERDEFIYHDMICHVPLFTHSDPKKVLIIGGGDGGTAREVLRHKSVEECVMVEIDAMVVEACKKFIPQTSSSLNDSRLKLLIDDGVRFVAESDESFDVILVDSTDPIGPAQPLFGAEFYKNVNKRLNDDGIVVSQGGTSHYAPEMQKKMFEVLNKIFPINMFYNFSNLTYPGMWSFNFSSKKVHPIRDFHASRVLESQLKFEYYNPQIHVSSFSLPSYMQRNLMGVVKA